MLLVAFYLFKFLSSFLKGETGIEMLRGWLDNIFATTSNTNLIIVGTHLDKVRKSKEPGFPERMRQLVKELVELPKYNNGQIISVYIKEVSCALDNREGKGKEFYLRWLYSFFFGEGVDTNGVNVRVSKKNFYFDYITKSKGFR